MNASPPCGATARAVGPHRPHDAAPPQAGDAQQAAVGGGEAPLVLARFRRAARCALAGRRRRTCPLSPPGRGRGPLLVQREGEGLLRRHRAGIGEFEEGVERDQAPPEIRLARRAGRAVAPGVEPPPLAAEVVHRLAAAPRPAPPPHDQLGGAARRRRNSAVVVVGGGADDPSREARTITVVSVMRMLGASPRLGRPSGKRRGIFSWLNAAEISPSERRRAASLHMAGRLTLLRRKSEAQAPPGRRGQQPRPTARLCRRVYSPKDRGNVSKKSAQPIFLISSLAVHAAYALSDHSTYRRYLKITEPM